MAIRANVVLDEEIWSALQKIPRGARSRAVNAALADWLRRSQRARALAEMDEIRARDRGARRSAEALLRQDRRSH